MRVSRRTHPDILRLLDRQKSADQSDPCASVLNAVNAFDALGTLEKRPPGTLHIFGPKALSSAVLIWYKPAGYHTYKTITLFGLWASERDDMITLSAGTQTLTYCLPFYNPESYFYRIREDFTRFYGADVPPPASPIWQATYTPTRRLDIRREIDALIREWHRIMDT